MLFSHTSDGSFEAMQGMAQATRGNAWLIIRHMCRPGMTHQGQVALRAALEDIMSSLSEGNRQQINERLEAIERCMSVRTCPADQPLMAYIGYIEERESFDVYRYAMENRQDVAQTGAEIRELQSDGFASVGDILALTYAQLAERVGYDAANDIVEQLAKVGLYALGFPPQDVDMVNGITVAQALYGISNLDGLVELLDAARSISLASQLRLLLEMRDRRATT